jgi:TNF receptor-associated protein 1
MSSGLRQVMGMMDRANADQLDKNLTMEINPNHEIIVKLNQMRKTDVSIAAIIVRQLLDNSMLAAGITTDTRSVINRINKLILHVFDGHSGENQNLKMDQEANRE